MADTVLVTGISGFIAKHCALTLLREGYDVRGTLRSLPGADAVRDTLRRHAGEYAEGADVDARVSFVAANLDADEGWDEAAAGCAYVLHVASPFPMNAPRDREALVPAARGGALRVLAAAKRAGVRRVVLTSSTVAVMDGHGADGRTFTEDDWTIAQNEEVRAYALSKTLAERAAWEFARAEGLDLAVVNPGFVLGPVLDDKLGTSAELVRQFMQGKYPGAPKLSFVCVDVRDVAEAHVRAMTVPKAGGHRHICAPEALWMREIAGAIAEAMPEYRAKLPTRELPNLAVRALSIVNPPIRQVAARAGQAQHGGCEPCAERAGHRVPRRARGRGGYGTQPEARGRGVIHLAPLEAACAALPSTWMVVQWGGLHVWKVGPKGDKRSKMFAVLSPEGSANGPRTSEGATATLKVAPEREPILRELPGVTTAPHLPRGDWLMFGEGWGAGADGVVPYLAESHAIVAAGLPKALRPAG